MLVRGLAVAVGVVLGLMLAVASMDHFVMARLEQRLVDHELALRWALIVITALPIAVVLLWALIHPILARFSDTGLARGIEALYPDLQERLSSAVELLASGDPEPIRGSPTMIGLLVRQAEEGARAVRPSVVVRWNRVVRTWSITGVLGLVVCVAVLVAPGPFVQSLRRLLLANAERAGRTEVVIVGAGDRVVPEGEPVAIRAEVRGAEGVSAKLLVRGSDGRIAWIDMHTAGDGAGGYVGTIPRVEGAGQYRVQAGDGRTRWYSIRAVRRPTVARLAAVVTPPAYSRRAVQEIAALPDVLKVLRQSRVEVRVRSIAPIVKAVMECQPGSAIPLESRGGCEYGGTLTALETVAFRVRLVDEHGFENLAPPGRQIVVVSDAPPSVTIEQPAKGVTLKPTDTLSIRYQARDDLGVARAELLVSVGGREPLIGAVPLPEAGRVVVEGEAVLDLSRLGPLSVRQVGYRLRVWDTRPMGIDSGPQSGESAWQEITIDSGVASLPMQVLRNVRKEFQAGAKQMSELLEASAKQVDKLKASAAASQPFSPEQAAQTEALRQTLRQAEVLSQQMVDLTRETDYQEVGDSLRNEVTRAHVVPAEQLLTEGKLLSDRHDVRADRFARAGYELRRAKERLSGLVRQFDDATVYREAAQALADAAARQARLSGKMEGPISTETASRPAGATSLPISSLPSVSPVSPEGVRRSGGSAATRPSSAGERAMTAPDMPRLTKEQEELIRSMREMIAANPQTHMPVLKAEVQRNKTLLEELGQVVARQDQLSKWVQNQTDRDALRPRREELAKAQKELGGQLVRVGREHADLLQQTGIKAVSDRLMVQAASELLDERPADAMVSQAEAAKELGNLSQAVGAAAKQTLREVPDAQVHRQRAASARDLANQLAALAQQQRQFASQTGQIAAQRDSRAAEPAGAGAAERAASLRKQIEQEDGALSARQREMRQSATRLVGQTTKLIPAMKVRIEEGHPVASMHEALQALGRHEPRQASAAQEQASREMDSIAKDLQTEAQKAEAAAAAAVAKSAEVQRKANTLGQIAQTVAQFQQQQTQLRSAVQGVGRQLAPLGENLELRITADLVEQQKRLAERADRLADELGDPSPADESAPEGKPHGPAQTAAMAVQDSLEAITAMASERLAAKGAGGSSPSPAAAVAELQRQAADRLDELTAGLGRPLDPNTEQWEEKASQQYSRLRQAEYAAELAEDQRRIAQQLEKIAAGQPLKAVALEQEALRRSSTDFANAADYLKDQLQAMAGKTPTIRPELAVQLTRAAEMLRQTAPGAMRKAAEELDQHRAGGALPRMGEARRALGDAQNLLGDFQKRAAGIANKGSAPGSSEEQLGRELTESLHDQYEALQAMLAARQAGAGDSKASTSAAQSGRAQRALEAAMASARVAAGRLEAGTGAIGMLPGADSSDSGSDGDALSSSLGGSSGDGNWRAVTPDFSELDGRGSFALTRSDWARLPGVLREEILQTAQEKSPIEYRELIARYFKAISRPSGAGNGHLRLDDARKPR